MKKLFSVLLLFLTLIGATYAQTVIRGNIKSTDGSTLPGANVLVKGGSNGTVTDADGNFTLSVMPSDIITVSFVGHETAEIAIGGKQVLEVTLKESSELIEQIVVTALGIEKRTKTIGYSVQEVKGEELTQAREPNVIDALTAKIAGVTIVTTPSGVGSSSRITIRGERSLDINKNQPLFVVDGVPISNEYSGSSGRNNLDADYGNPAGMINPDDIESMTVLKGANASALYGSRAANGVIVITTKSGKSKNRIGISFTSTSMFETVLRLPEYQNVYGQGLNGEFSFLDGKGGGLRDGTDESWGPKFEGQLIPQFDSPRTAEGYRGGDTKSPGAQGSAIIPTPWEANPDNVKDFFETGHFFTNSIALDGINEKGSFRLSYTWADEKGTVPNTGVQKNTVSFNGSYKLSGKLSTGLTFNYLDVYSKNRPNLSYGTENIMYLFNCWIDRGMDLNSLKNYWQKGLEGTQQFNFNYNYHDNPYFQLYENTNAQDLNRIYGNVNIKYDIVDWIYIMARVGNDYSSDIRPRRRALSTQRFPYGAFREERINFQELNYDLILGLNRTIGASWNLNATLGATQMNQSGKYLDVMAPQLLVPEVYSLNNSRAALQYSQYNKDKRINSVFGSFDFAFKDYWFITATARNDWSSTLPAANNSYFYPSLSSSFVLSDMIKMPGFLSFAKLRAGVAQVGNDTDPYQLTQPFKSDGSFGDSYTYSESSVLVNSDLKPEISTSTEGGADLRFLNNRIGLSATYYHTISRNQILRVPITNTSGYTAKILNAGKIKNNGLELSLNIVPVKSSSFSWMIDVNWSKNNSEILELTDEIPNYVMASRYITVEAWVGGRMGDMYGIGFLRNPDGEIIYRSNGRPEQTTEKILLGNYNPDWLAGINNTVSYKNLVFSFLFDIRQGGEVYSHTQTVGREGGMLIETLEGRPNGYDLSLPENGVIGKGVVKITDAGGNVTGYAPNTTKVSSREWHSAYTNGRKILEGCIYDASFVKLREVKLGYKFPDRIWGRVPMKDVNISLVGRNLYLWTKVPHIDPENLSVSGGTLIPGVESMSIPSGRSFGFSLNLNF